MKLHRRQSTRIHRRHRDRRLLLERLEGRALLATLWVDNTPGTAGTEFTATGGTQPASVPGLVPGVDIFSTIGAAVAAANPSDTINVSDGTYSELVQVNKSVTLQGNQFGADARTRSGTETIVNGQDNGGVRSSAFYITANNAIVDGFTARDESDGNQFGAGVVMAATDLIVRNNIITNNQIGLFTNNSGASVIERNLFDGNNTAGPAGGAGIYSEASNGLTIDDNEFRNHTQNNPLLLAATGAGSHVNITVSDNSLSNSFGVFALGISGGVFQGNTITTTDPGGATALSLGDGCTGIDVLNNVLEGNARGLRIANFGFGFGAVSDVEAHYNSFANNSEFGLGVIDFGAGQSYSSATLDATCNWWGDITGPTTADNPAGTGSVLQVDAGNGVVDFQPWLVYAPDGDAATAGVQLVSAFDVPAQTAGFTTTNNNYRRLVNVIECIQSGQSVTLSGNFDWTETNAAASWALGNDGVASTADDYSIVVPTDINTVTITALTQGDAVIQGPGDLAAANLEGVFVFDGGDNPNWHISNLHILDFDLAIGMFNGAGGSDAFNGTVIASNLIRIPADLNATVAPVDVNQNIGIHYSFGTNQIISSNIIQIVGSGASDGANFSSSVGMQSNTSGGAVYDGLLIDNNFLFVSGVLDAQPASILGIWENGHAHSSDITVNNNRFHNQTGANSATNLMRAFRVTSHSSATTTVTYSDNAVDGANVGFQWLAGQNFAGNQPVRLQENVIVNSNTGVLVQSNGNVNLFRNTITGSAVSGVNVTSGTLDSATENVISGGANHGLELAVGVSAGAIFNNNLSGNAGLAVNNVSGTLVDASGNWWGGNTLAAVSGEVSGNVDFTPWLDSGSDTSADPGFQGDFNSLHVDDNSPQAAATGRISEGLDLLLGGGALTIHSGTYIENVDVTTQGTTLVLGSGAASVEIDGNFTLDSDDFLELDLGNNPGTTGDLLDVSGAVALGNATATLNALEPLNAGNTLVVLKRGSGSDFFGNLAQLEQLTVDGNFVTARYDLADGNDFGFVTQQNPSIGNAGGTLNYTEDDPPTLIIPTATVSDLDQAVLNNGYLQVLISQNAEATDNLAIRSVGSGPGEIQVVGNLVQYEGNTFGTVSGGNGTPLQVDFDSSGNATIAAVQALVRSITFESTSDAPATTKKALFFLDDGTGGTGAINKDIAITLVNDAPILDTSADPALTPVSEDATDPAGTAVSSLIAGAFSDPDGPGSEGIAVTSASPFWGDWEYSLDGGASWNDLTGASPSAAILLPDTALVRFIPQPDFNGSVQLFYHAWDQTTGTAGGTLPAIGQPHTSSVGAEWDGAEQVVTPVNDAPVLDTSLNPTLNPTSEDAQVPASTLVADLIAGAITDVDEGALEGIAVTSASTFWGVWEYSLDDGASWTSMGAPSPSAALLLPSSARVRFDPEPDFNGTVKLFYHAWDQTEGTDGGTLPALGQPDTASVGAQWEGASLTVTPTNDAPVIDVGGPVGYAHDASAIQVAPTATVDDIDSPDFDGGRLRVRITDGASATNRLSIGGGFTVDSNNNVLRGSTIIGERVSNGFGTNELVVRFNVDATPFIAQQLVRAITFKTVGGAAGDRKVVFDIKDGDGGLSNEASKIINVT